MLATEPLIPGKADRLRHEPRWAPDVAGDVTAQLRLMKASLARTSYTRTHLRIRTFGGMRLLASGGALREAV